MSILDVPHYYYARDRDHWSVNGPHGALLDGLTKGEAAGFASILNGRKEEELWGDHNLIGRRSERRMKLLIELKDKAATTCHWCGSRDIVFQFVVAPYFPACEEHRGKFVALAIEAQGRIQRGEEIPKGLPVEVIK